MIENLKKILKQEDTVLFIGSGVSLWSGLPSWSVLILELIEFLKVNGMDPSLTEQEYRRGDLLQAASYGFDKLTKPNFAEFIRKSCRLGIAKPHEIHYKILSLGPSCYITTNYDKLLELSFNKWSPDIYFRSVVNKQLTETAEIVGARAKNFLFKLHGDAEDSDSIILTREQYRSLNFGGELYHALETTKTLMVSRPIVYIGFGLRDPDFLYLKDLLINTYRGGARDHYAIMADVNDQEKDYWRRNFGIHLIDYKTTVNEDGTKNHSPILGLLEKLNSKKEEIHSSELKLDSEFVLSLNRHAAKYSGFENSTLHLPLIVHPNENKESGKSEFYSNRYYEAPIETLLDNGPDKLILIGLPGGGKSYSLKGSVARLSKLLAKECIEDSLKINTSVIPIYVDLKLYQGSILDIVEQNIPVGMSIELLSSNFKVKLYLDAFNEIPKEYIESNHWTSDFTDFMQKVSLSLVVSSRTIDGLERMEFPCYNLDSLDKDFIKTSLAKNELELKGLFKDEIILLLQKPFFYKLIFENNLKINSDSTPQGIYSDLVELINHKFQEKFQISFNLSDPISKAAMDSLDNGEEAFKIEILNNYIKLELENCKVTSVTNSQIINWLISQNFIVPIINERICFFHQSVTEYLAATRLATMFVDNDKILKEKLSYRSWDQALYLTLSLLGTEDANKFLETVLNIDFKLALSSIKYMETDTKEIVNRLLLELGSRSFKDHGEIHQISHVLRSKIPVSEFHIPALKELIKLGNTLGANAVDCLLDILGYDFKSEALSLLVERCNDYNFCTEIGRSLKKYMSEDDLPKLLIFSNQVQKKLDSGEIKKYEGFDSALGDLMVGFSPDLVFNTFYDPTISIIAQKVQIEVICEFLYGSSNNESLKISAKLLLKGIDHMAFVIHIILNFSKPEDNIDHSIFEAVHLNKLLRIVKNKRNRNTVWALCSITNICSKREDLINFIQKEIEKSSGVLKAALIYSISSENDQKLVFETLEELLDMDMESLDKEPFRLISHMDKLDWSGREVLFIKLLRLRNMKLAYCLCDRFVVYEKLKHQLILDIGSINWWLEWFSEYYESKSNEWMFIDRVPSFISTHIPKEKRNEFIIELNNPKSPFRRVLIQTVLRKINGLSIADFTEETLTYLLEDLKNPNRDFWRNSILTDIATETFVYERLIPRLKIADDIEKENLKKLIEKIGSKHKRRYILE